jgi:hypothetical protein
MADNSVMTRADSVIRSIRQVAGKILAVIREGQDAQRRMAALRTAPDRTAVAVDTYAEFLYLTSGVLRHEPSARARARGHGARR